MDSIAIYYKYIYLFVVTVGIIICSKNISTVLITDNNLKTSGNVYSAFGIVMFFILFFGLRPVHPIFVDMNAYHYHITHLQSYSPFEKEVENLIFDNLVNFWSYNQIESWSFFLLIAAIYIIFMYIACVKIFPKHNLLAFFVYLSAFSTFSYGTNGIKAGAAASIFLAAIAYREKRIFSVLLLGLSWCFHHSMSMPIIAYILTYFYKKNSHYYIFWIFCLLMAAGHVTFFQNLLSNYTDDKGASYLLSTDENWAGKTGFRLDFIIYSSIPILVSWFSTQKLQIKSKLYTQLVNMYLVCNGLWMLCMYVNYNNRIAYLSWFLYPIVLLLPTLDERWKNNGYIGVRNVVFLHLAFTLFMSLIYY